MTNPFTPERTHPWALAHPVQDGGAMTLTAVDAIGFVDWDVSNDRLTWDRGAEERFGVPAGSMSTIEGWATFVDPADAERIRTDIGKVMAEARDRFAYRYRFYRPDGEVRLFEGVALCWFDERLALSRMTGVVLDITRSEAARMALTRSEAQLRTIIDTVPDALLMVDVCGTLRGFSQSAERMFGYAAADVVGKHVTTLIPDADAHLTGETVAGAAAAAPLEGRRANGDMFVIELSVGEAAYAGERIRTCFVRDVSDRVEAARRLDAARAQYLRTARLNAMGAVAAGLAHELNQPLAASANYLAAAKLSLDGGVSTGELSALLDQAGAQIALAGNIIRGLRSFLSREETAPERLSLAWLVDEAAALAFAGRKRPDIRLTMEGDAPVPDLLGERVQLLQVFVNLLRNADDAMPMTGVRAIRIAARAVGDMVDITVSDSGPGFSPDVLASLEYGVDSSKGPDRMGFGLAICRRIVERWGGRISWGNLPEGGARIALTVPMARD